MRSAKRTLSCIKWVALGVFTTWLVIPWVILGVVIVKC